MSKLADDLEHLSVPKANHFDDTHDAILQRAILERIAPQLPALLRALEEWSKTMLPEFVGTGAEVDGAADLLYNTYRALLEAAGHEQ
jgi:hypothetical protein